MLNNPFRYLRRTWTMQSPRTTNALYSVHQPACDCASASSFLPIGICKSNSHQRALVEAWFIGVNEKGTPCTKAFFFVQVRRKYLKGLLSIPSDRRGARRPWVSRSVSPLGHAWVISSRQIDLAIHVIPFLHHLILILMF